MGSNWPTWTERNSEDRWARPEGTELEAVLGAELGAREGTALGAKLGVMDGTEGTELGAMLDTDGSAKG